MLNPLVQIKITETVCGAVAVGSTVFRLWVRRRDLFWDDAWALLSMFLLLVQVAGIYMHVPNPALLSKTNRIAAYYIIAQSFYAVIWTARLSILFSVIRFDPDPRARRILYHIGIAFVLALLVLMGQLFWVCEPMPGWKDTASPQCPLTKQVAILQIVTDVLADMILIIAPLRLVLGITDRVLRNRLIVIFSTCIATTIVSMVHAALIITSGGVKVVIAALVEDCLSLIVANLPIVVTSVIRLSGSRDDPDRYTRKKGAGSLTFATTNTTFFTSTLGVSVGLDTIASDASVSDEMYMKRPMARKDPWTSGVVVSDEQYSRMYLTGDT